MPQQICHRCMSHITCFLPFLKLCQESAAQWNYLSERLIDISIHTKATTAFIFVTDSRVQTVLERRRDKEKNGNLKNVIMRMNRLRNETKKRLRTFGKPLEELESIYRSRAKLFTCPECDSTYRNLSKINLHLANQNKILCQHCHKIVDLKSFGEHLEAHTISFFRCDVCSLPFECKEQLGKHKNVHKGRNMCAECKRTFRTANTLTLHVHRRHQPDFCNNCNRKFSNRICLYKHRNKCKSNTTKQYICDYCSKEFNNRSVIKSHITLIHSKQLMHQCEQCGKKFNSACHLEEHYETHDVILDRYVCQYCDGKMYRTSGGYRRHMRQKHYSVHPELKGQAKYSCDVCMRNFISEKNLNNHLKAKKHEQRIREQKY